MSADNRVGIVTPYGLFNYGNRLQNYAVDTLLRARGYAPETLILRRKPATAHVKDFIKWFAHTLGLGGTRSAKYKSFRAFDRPLIKRRTWSDGHLKRVAKRYKTIVIGSDQIWNPHQVNLGGLEYATFAPGSRKVAISPSFGIDELPRDRLDRIAPWLESIDSLSVREHAGQAIIKKATGITAPVLIDPTLALDVKQWREVAESTYVPDRPYIFVYLLGKHQDGLRTSIRMFAAERGCEVVTLMDKAEPKYHGAGPQHFVALIDNAQAVIADSFHAAVFSHMFDTPFFLADRTDGVSMSSRFMSFCKTFALDSRPSPALPGTHVLEQTTARFSTLLAEQRLGFDAYLDDALSENRRAD